MPYGHLSSHSNGEISFSVVYFSRPFLQNQYSHSLRSFPVGFRRRSQFLRLISVLRYTLPGVSRIFNRSQTLFIPASESNEKMSAPMEISLPNHPSEAQMSELNGLVSDSPASSIVNEDKILVPGSSLIVSLSYCFRYFYMSSISEL